MILIHDTMTQKTLKTTMSLKSSMKKRFFKWEGNGVPTSAEQTNVMVVPLR